MLRGTGCRLFLLALALAPLLAQDDLRDVVQLQNGKELRGRVLDPFATDELLLLQGGKRLRVVRTDIKSLQLVGDAVREFLDRRLRLRDNPRAQWILVEWAQQKGLQNLARLQATTLALRDDDARAHAFLGHRQRNGEWQWEQDGRWLPQAGIEAALVKQPLVLAGERFRVRTDHELRGSIDALFDLERLGVWWYDTFGMDLLLREALQPVEVVLWRDSLAFPKWGFRPMPFYVPDPHGDEARTFFAGVAPPRPRQLMFVGAQALLYRSLIGDTDFRDDRDRVCAWLEIGLPMLAEHALAGDPGFVTKAATPVRDLVALQALGRDYRLTHLLHLPMYGGFYLMDDTPTATNWSAATMLVQFLLDDGNQPATRAPFLRFVRAALAEHKGDSSSAFDQAMGRRVEDLEEPFRKWLEKAAGY